MTGRRRGQRQTAAAAAPPALALLAAAAAIAAAAGCTSPAESLASHDSELAAGRHDKAESALREGLERHPDDVELLLAAVDFYLRPEPEESYRPRLALHYAMRADKSSNFQDKRAAAALLRATRAAGVPEEAEALIRQGLAAVHHPDADAPRLPGPVDPGLVDPTLANLLEESRRRTAAAAGSGEAARPRCPDGLRHVPAGLYPSSSGPDVQLAAALCIETWPAGEPALPPLPDAAARASWCATLDRRDCRPDERAVACDALRGLVGDHPACEDPARPRCCSGASAPDARGAPGTASPGAVAAPPLAAPDPSH